MPTDEMVKAMLDVFYGPGWRYWPTSSISEGKDRARRALAAAEGVGRVPCAFPQNCGREWCDCPEQQTAPTTPAAPPPAVGGVAAEIAAERRRQIEKEGWTPEHDDQHDNGELAKAAAAYTDHAARFHDAETLGVNYRIKAPNPLWPWESIWWKPASPRRDLIKAAALIVAEIERLDRATIAAPLPAVAEVAAEVEEPDNA